MFANMASHSIEVTEAEMPIALMAYEFVADKAGAGKFRGGVPFRRDYRFLEHEGMLQVRSDRRDHRPFGLYGGSPGQPSENYLNPDADERLLPSKLTMTISKGDVFRHVLAGAGGWGDPLERDPAAVLRDVRNELLSAARAKADYGVIVDTTAWRSTRRRPSSAAPRSAAARGWREVPKVAVARSGGADPGRRITAMAITYRVGVDIGGTFTDIVLLGSDGIDPHQEDLVERRQLRPGDRRRPRRGVSPRPDCPAPRSRRSATARPSPPTRSSSTRARASG